MKTRLVRIGNSRGVRLPKPLITEAGLSEEVELRVQEGAILIVRAVPPRTGWAEAARELHGRDEDMPVDPVPSTRFDKREWKW